ncbi:hypothetical protein D354_02288 [Enterococcus faecalis]|nr:hypothetical protein HMPREF9499_00926 [Enterococcus faecalis TX0012]EPI17808.1 hypothetical protein D354_02288 [Enterococcus faecalis]EPI28464.1 hypothetical protein D351_01772 [Enterococcus faecalis WKS-26-18-2]
MNESELQGFSPDSWENFSRRGQQQTALGSKKRLSISDLTRGGNSVSRSESAGDFSDQL